MGLDMYLKATRYLGRWKHQLQTQEWEQHEAVLKALGLPETAACSESPSLEVSVTVAYWRKANAIHAWFIRECASGVDDCQKVYVGREHLEQLRSLCQTLLENRDASEAAERLPPQEGFFFGGTEIDDGYWQDLQDTVDQLGYALGPVFADWGFEYKASW